MDINELIINVICTIIGGLIGSDITMKAIFSQARNRKLAHSGSEKIKSFATIMRDNQRSVAL